MGITGTRSLLGVSMTSERMVHVKLECFAVFLFDKFIDQHICTV